MNTSHLITCFEEIWNSCPEGQPVFSTSYSTECQRERETIFTSYLDKFRKVQEEIRNSKSRPDTHKFFSHFGLFMKTVYDYSDEALSIILHPDLTQVSRSFFDQARSFDPALKQEEIYQAMRNVWIMNGLQLLLDKKVEITPSIFAYSLLYPYSDNILDDPSITHDLKIQFSERFEKRLSGTGFMNKDHRERKISELVGMIETQYPRDLFPGVHGSLKAIHNAQTRSLQLMKNGKSLTPEKVLSISFDKGGSSVLADGFLVAGNLSSEIQRFFFGFGVWLQLADDIQDIPEDLKSDTLTLFSKKTSPDERINLVNKVFHFGRNILEDIKYCHSEVCIPFRKVILQSIELMLIHSIGMNNSYFQPVFCEFMEQFSPVGFAFLKEAKKKGSPGRLKLITQMMEVNPG
jgi:hypothetical protein